MNSTFKKTSQTRENVLKDPQELNREKIVLPKGISLLECRIMGTEVS